MSLGLPKINFQYSLNGLHVQRIVGGDSAFRALKVCDVCSYAIRSLSYAICKIYNKIFSPKVCHIDLNTTYVRKLSCFNLHYPTSVEFGGFTASMNFCILDVDGPATVRASEARGDGVSEDEDDVSSTT